MCSIELALSKRLLLSAMKANCFSFKVQEHILLVYSFKLYDFDRRYLKLVVRHHGKHLKILQNKKILVISLHSLNNVSQLQKFIFMKIMPLRLEKKNG